MDLGLRHEGEPTLAQLATTWYFARMGSMQDFMRSGSGTPKYVLDVPALELTLGAPLGPVLVELSRSACKLDPFSPWVAFEGLQMHLVYLLKDFKREEELNDPDDVLVFLETGVDLHAAGFVDDGTGRPLDERLVCLLCDGDAKVVAPNLAAFLGLAAVAGVEALVPEPTIEELLTEGAEARLDDEIGELSKALCRLPGVTLPRARRAKVAGSTRPRRPTANLDEEPRETGLARVRQLIRGGRLKEAQKELVKQIDICLPIADLVAAERWREIESLLQEVAPPLKSETRAVLTARGLRLE